MQPDTLSAMPTRVAVGSAVCELPPLSSASQAGGFIFSLYKAGSTMLFGAMRQLVAKSDALYIDVGQRFRAAGIVLEQAQFDDPGKQSLYEYLDKPGIVFGGWREFPLNYGLPLHPQTRTLLLVRDPRDILTSHFFSLKFSHTTKGPGGELVSRARRRLEEEDIDAFAIRMAPRLRRYFEDYRRLEETRRKVFRYEDIIFDKERFLTEVCGHLELDVPARRVARIAQAIDIRPEAEDVFAHVRKVAPGDHTEKLKPETITRLNGMLREALEEHSYSFG